MPTYSDECGVCDGDGSSANCIGICFGTGPFPPLCPAPTTVFVGLSRLFTTIQQGIDAATDIVQIDAGTYAPFSFNGRRITVRSEHADPSTVIIDCQSMASSIGITVANAETFGSIIQGVTIQNCMAGGISIQALNPTTLSRFTIKDVIIRNSFGTGQTPAGIDCRGCVVRIERSALQDLSGIGINVRNAIGQLNELVSAAIVTSSRYAVPIKKKPFFN